MTRWKEYFEDILNNDQTNLPTNDIEIPDIAIENAEVAENDQIEMEEVIEAIQWLKRGKAAGHDSLTSEMIKNMQENGMEVLTRLFNRIWNEQKIPEEWEIGILLPIHKKGDNRVCNNYRGITLLSVMLKTYERILEKRLQSIIEIQLEEPQSGFRKGRGIQDHIFTLKQIIEKNPNSKIHVAFIDIEKAFDSIPRNEIWNSLRKRNVDNNQEKLSLAHTKIQGTT